MAVTREALVQQSVQDEIKRILFEEKAYPEDRVIFLDAFPYDRWQEGETLDQNYVAVGFNFDDGGRAAEMGSDLVKRVYTIEFFVFALSAVWASNLANAVKFSVDVEGRIPLKNVAVAGAPIIDYLLVRRASAERQVIPDPEPFQQFVWTAHIEVEDEYHAALAF